MRVPGVFRSWPSSVNRNRKFGSLAGRISPVCRTIKIKNSQAYVLFVSLFVSRSFPLYVWRGLRVRKAAIRERCPSERQKVLSGGVREIMIYLRTVISYIYRAGIQACTVCTYSRSGVEYYRTRQARLVLFPRSRLPEVSRNARLENGFTRRCSVPRRTVLLAECSFRVHRVITGCYIRGSVNSSLLRTSLLSTLGKTTNAIASRAYVCTPIVVNAFASLRFATACKRVDFTIVPLHSEPAASFCRDIFLVIALG